MTDNSDKIRSIVLAALMVFSVFAGTVAFAGTAAAAVGNASFTATPDDGGANADLTASVDYTGSGYSFQNVRLSFNGANDFDGSFSGVDDADVEILVDGSSAGTATVGSTSNGGATITVGLGSSYSLSGGETVTVQINNDAFANPSVADSYSGTIDLDPQSSGESTTASLSIATTGGGDGSDDTNFQNGGIVFAGQTAAWDAADATGETVNNSYTLYEVTSSDTGTPVRELTYNGSSGFVNVSTSDLETGQTYYISNNDNPRNPANSDIDFTIRAQDFGAAFDDGEAGNAGAASLEALQFTSSNRQGDTYTVEVTEDGDDLTEDELEQIFGNFDPVSSVGDDDDAVVITVDGQQTANANFTGIDAANYSFTFDVTDTTAVDEDNNVTVSNVGAGTADLGFSSITEQRGDVLTFNVTIDGAADKASVVMGNYDTKGYQLNFTAYDENGDGMVQVAVNTYAAGHPAVGNSAVVSAVGSEDSVENIQNQSDGDLSAALATDNYRVSTIAGDAAYSDAEDTPDNVATVNLRERSTDSASIWVAPGSLSSLDTDDEGSATTAADVVARVEGGSLTQSDTVAMGDTIVLEVSASGLGGLAELSGDELPADTFYNTSLGAYGNNLTAEQIGNIGNFEAKELNVSATDISVVSAEDSDAHYFVMRNVQFERGGSNVQTAAGDEFEVSYSVNDDFLLGSSLTDDHQSVNDTYEAAPQTVSIDEDPVNVTAATNQSITGTSSLAPGSDVTVRLESDDEVSPPFFKTSTVEVQPDGTWSASFDFDEQSTGDTFGVEVDARSASATADGNIVESTMTETATATATATEQPETETATATATATEAPETETEAPDTETEEPDTETTTTTTPGFGVAVALVALLAAALLAGRRE